MIVIDYTTCLWLIACFACFVAGNYWIALKVLHEARLDRLEKVKED